MQSQWAVSCNRHRRNVCRPRTFQYQGHSGNGDTHIHTTCFTILILPTLHHFLQEALSQFIEQKFLTLLTVFLFLQISFNTVLFPSVALCYMGQVAYLRKFPEDVADSFFRSIPGINGLGVQSCTFWKSKHSTSKINYLFFYSTNVLANLRHCHSFGYHCKPSYALWRIRHPLQGIIPWLFPQCSSDPYLKEL